MGHHPQHLQSQVDALIYSSAVAANHPELAAAQDAQIITLRRGELLGQLMRAASQRVAVAGTHGKTTTTGLISHLLIQAGLNPTCVNGGVINGQASTVNVGNGQCFVAEADESDASFLALNPTIAVVKVRYEKFMELLRFQKTLQKNVQRTQEKLNELRKDADKIILNLWNEIEDFYSKEPDKIKRSKSSIYGVVYVFRKNELKDNNLRSPMTAIQD